MKKVAISLLFLLLVLISCPVYSEYDSQGNSLTHNFRYLEPSKNLLYVAVMQVKNKNEHESSTISNIAIVNLYTNLSSYIFKEDFKENIISLYFETEINSTGVIEFNDNIAKNNTGLAMDILKYRRVKEQLCICTYDKEKKLYSIWYCSKQGLNLRHVISFNEGTEWWSTC